MVQSSENLHTELQQNVAVQNAEHVLRVLMKGDAGVQSLKDVGEIQIETTDARMISVAARYALRDIQSIRSENGKVFSNNGNGLSNFHVLVDMDGLVFSGLRLMGPGVYVYFSRLTSLVSLRGGTTLDKEQVDQVAHGCVEVKVGQNFPCDSLHFPRKYIHIGKIRHPRSSFYNSKDLRSASHDHRPRYHDTRSRQKRELRQEVSSYLFIEP